jgi:hypothetical protein
MKDNESFLVALGRAVVGIPGTQTRSEVCLWKDRDGEEFLCTILRGSPLEDDDGRDEFEACGFGPTMEEAFWSAVDDLDPEDADYVKGDGRP